MIGTFFVFIYVFGFLVQFHRDNDDAIKAVLWPIGFFRLMIGDYTYASVDEKVD